MKASVHLVSICYTLEKTDPILPFQLSRFASVDKMKAHLLSREGVDESTTIFWTIHSYSRMQADMILRIQKRQNMANCSPCSVLKRYLIPGQSITPYTQMRLCMSVFHKKSFIGNIVSS